MLSREQEAVMQQVLVTIAAQAVSAALVALISVLANRFTQRYQAAAAAAA